MKNELDKVLLEKLTDFTNRSKGQTLFLFELCDNDFDKLLLLEKKLKEFYCNFCPGTKERVEEFLNMKK